MKIAKLIVDGLMSIADAAVEAKNYSYPKSGGFASDERRLAGDVRAVGNDMRKAINQHGSKQTYKRSGT